MELDPLNIFSSWYKQHLTETKERLPAACCLSTTGLDDYPNARFVSLKEVTADGFIVTGTLTSRKGAELERSGKAALSFWWPESEKQVRIQGDVSLIAQELADHYFSERNRDSQIVSQVSRQGEELNDAGELSRQYEALEHSGEAITRPGNWGGYLIRPKRIEFLEFKPSRFHDRKLYYLEKGKWKMKHLQP